jgi:cytochrome c oxidase cbb3-type subunit 1
MSADLEDAQQRGQRAVAETAWHSLFWLVLANAIGVMLATLLLFPALNGLLGEWTYGRWMMVHMNLELYGWASLPLVGFLFRTYRADRGRLANSCRPVLWAWSMALGAGAISWLSGHSSGKLFLDWSGFTRVLFPVALMALWLLLVLAFVESCSSSDAPTTRARAARLLGLLILLAVPFVLYTVANPNSYPPVNPDTGGPTGTSQLESSLAIVGILLILPFGITRRKAGHVRMIAIAWIVLLAESLLCAALGHSDISYHSPAQYLSLGSLLVWLPLAPTYYAGFQWHQNTRRWRLAFLWWWAALVVTGWLTSLPGVLDRLKFTDGLVGHSFVAMAGFASSLLIFMMVQLLGDGGWVFNRARSFYLWNGGAVGYVVVMIVAGWRERFDPAFTIVLTSERNFLYTLRLLTGVMMFLSSLDWLIDASTLLREPVPVSTEVLQEKTA